MLPTDKITIYYSVESQTSELSRVALDYRNEIETILKNPFIPLNDLLDQNNSNMVINKKLSVSLFLFKIMMYVEISFFLLR